MHRIPHPLPSALLEVHHPEGYSEGVELVTSWPLCNEEKKKKSFSHAVVST